MRIMTYNIQHGRDYHYPAPSEDRIDLSQVLSVIRDFDPVFCTLNEVRGDSDHPDYTDQTGFLAKSLGWNGYFAEAIRFEGKNPYGNAIITKYPIVEAETILIPDPVEKKYDGYYETRCVLRALLDMDGKPFTVFAAHFGLNPDEAENAVTTLIGEISKCTTPFSVQGDFNLHPDSPLLQPLFDTLTDTAKWGEGPMYTWDSYTPRKKIDYIFVSKDVTVSGAKAPAVVAADHCPYYAEINF